MDEIEIVNGIYVVKNKIIKNVVDWFKNPGTSSVFYNYTKRKTGKELTEKEEYTTKRNAIKAKPAEMCEHLRLGVKIDLSMILRSDIKGDGGVDVKYGLKEIDVKTRDGSKFGISISKHLLNSYIPNRFFSAYTIVHPNYNVAINEDLEVMYYKYEGIIHSSELIQLKRENKLINKFKDTWEVPIEYFKIRS